MLKIGIVGKKDCDKYLSLLLSSHKFELAGIFDPSFQFDQPKNINPNQIFISFEELLKVTDSIIFASDENIFLPLIEMAIMHSKAIFLSSIHNLSFEEQTSLRSLSEESGEVLQIEQSLLYNTNFTSLVNLSNIPQFIIYDCSNSSNTNLLYKVRLGVGIILALIRSNVRKITVNVLSILSEVPDMFKIRLDFDNGSVADIIISSIETEMKHSLKSYEYNGFFHVDFTKEILTGKSNKNSIYINNKLTGNNLNSILERQLDNFYINIYNNYQPINCIENEVNTQKIIEKVKEKLRISVNI